MIQTKFVGSSRKQLVQHLVEQFEICRTLGSAKWISLEGPSGWGKTRVIQEFYKSIAAEQASPAYWPLEMVGSADISVGGPRLDVSRKTVSPSVRHVPGSLPTFMWWGISCTSRNGISSDALAEDLKQFKQHALYYQDAWLRARGLPARMAGSIGSISKQAADDSLNGFLDSGIGDGFLPGVSFIRTMGRRALDGLQAAQDRRVRFQSDQSIEPTMDLVDETFAMISRLVGPTLPLVMIVDDIHRIDEGLSRLLEKLISINASVLIISTALPGLLEDNLLAWPIIEGWWQERLDRVLHTDEIASKGGLNQLALGDRMSLVRDSYPLSSSASQKVVAERYTNPLAIALFCGIERVRREFEGDRELTESFVSDSPMTVRDLYRELWLDLPTNVRAILSMAARSVPSRIDSKWGRSNRWHLDILRKSIEIYFSEPARQMMLGTLADDSRFAWTRTVTENLREFVEIDEQIVAAHDDDLVSHSETSVFLEVVASLLDQYEIEDQDQLESQNNEDRLHIAWLALGLRREGVKVSDHVTASSALSLLAYLDRYPLELRAAIDIAEFALAECETVATVTPNIRLRLGDALHQVGRIDDAHRVFTSLIGDHKSEKVELSVAQYLSLRACTSVNFVKMGRTTNAVALLEELVAETETYFEDETAVHQRTEIRVHYANALAQTGKYEAAVDVLNELLNDSDNPVSSEDRLSATSIMANALQTAGRFGESIPIHRQLVLDATSRYSEDDPFTLAMVNNLATALHKSGDHLDESIELFDDVARRRNLVLGPNHPASLVVRNNKANALKDAGMFDKAQAEFESLIVDQQRLLGDDHPSSLLARHNLALLFEARGEDNLALELFQEVLEHRERILSPNHLALFVSKFTLGRALISVKQFDEAVVIFEELLASQREVLGDADDDTLRTWRYAINALAESGRAGKALKLAEKLVPIIRAKHGPDHLLTLQAEAELGMVLGATGRRRDAARKFSAVRARAVHFLGKDHELVSQMDRVAVSAGWLLR